MQNCTVWKLKGELKMQLVADKLTHAVESLFSNEIRQTNDNIKEHISRQDAISHSDIASMNCLHTLLEYHVWRLCHKTFVYEFHKYRESLSYPIDPLSSKLFDQYVNSIDEVLIGKWFTKYDYLRKMVTQTVNNTCSFIEEVCSNFSNDIDLLLAKGLISRGSRLQAITPLESDPHNNSKVILCLEFKPSKKIVYKPKSLEIDVLLDKVFSEILKFDTLQDYSPVPKTINRGRYGWQEFVRHTPVSQSELGRPYYNLGLCAAVFSCFGATDLHDENIIFNGEFPYVIDLETSLQPAYNRKCNLLHELMGETLSDSIASTSIIPAKLMAIPHKTLIGAINTPYPQKSNEMGFSMKNPGTDAVDIAKENITVTRSNVPITLTNNQAPDPLPFQKDFLGGYSDGYERVMNKREQISSIFTDIRCLIRVVIRPTSQYFLLLDACLFPENLIDEYTINQVLEYLKPPLLIKNSEVSRNILEEEMRSIKNGDIPYFSIRANDKRLYSRDFISSEIFDMSPKNNVMRRLDKLSQKRLLLDKRFIAEGYSDIRIQEAEHRKVKDLNHQSPIFSNVLQRMTKDNPYPLIELISALSITTGTGNAESGWIGGIYGEIPISYESTSLISLHDTGGIIFLWEHLLKYKKAENRPEHTNLFNQTKRGLRSLCGAFSSQLESAPISVISGSSSFDFIFSHNTEKVKEMEQVVPQIQSEDIPHSDVFVGAVGIGLMLASFSKTPNHILKSLDHKICNEIPLKSSDGVAHGNLGVLWAQFRLSYALKDIERCRFLLKQTLKIYFPDTVNTAGWCNGNSGLLMVLSEMAGVLNEQLDLYEIAKKTTTLPKNGSIDVSICHGAAGVLQSLLFAYETLEDSWYLELANQYWETVLDLSNNNGFYTGEKNRDYLLGYFLGWGGVADSAILLKMYNDGESAWLPLNLSSAPYQQRIIFKEEVECVH